MKKKIIFCFRMGLFSKRKNETEQVTRRRKRKKEKSPQKNEIALPNRGICLFQMSYCLLT